MPAIFVHGVPDTHRVWSPVIERLSRSDVVALALPGFGCSAPNGFTATKEAYVEWLIGQIERQAGPVDLVGHDWGCMLTARVASLRPDLVRSWAGGAGPISDEYEWHPFAKVVQTEGVGERYFMHFDRVAFAERASAQGVPPALAREAAERIDDRMAQCILALYRSALTIGREWAPELRQARVPSMVIWGLRDIACPSIEADRLAISIGTNRVCKLDAGHWFVLEQPEIVARELERHWALA